MKRIVSDGTCKCTTEVPSRTVGLLDGESYDARREMSGCDQPGFDYESWDSVAVVKPTDAVLVSQPDEQILISRKFKPISVKKSEPGRYRFDLGQNIVGGSQ